jgi:hypothetical protein
MGRGITTACTRPPISVPLINHGSRRLVMPGVRRLSFAMEAAVELSAVQQRYGLKEVKEDVLFILRRICRAGLELL